MQNCSRGHSHFFFYCFSDRIKLDSSCELSARQTIHMNCQALFSLKNTKVAHFRMLSGVVMIGTLRVAVFYTHTSA